MELYYFICQPLHYHQKVTTKRVVVGMVGVLAISLLLRVAYIAVENLENPDTTSQCGLQEDSTGPTDVFQHIMTGSAALAALVIFICYVAILKEARKQQQRDENRDLWLYQTRAFKKLAPHVISLAVWGGTVVLMIVSSRQNVPTKQNAIITRIGALLYTTLSSMVNPIVYSFRMPDFRRALRETFGWPSNAPVAQAPPPHGQQRQDLEMAVFSGPVRGQGGSTIEVAEAPPFSRLTQIEEDTSSTTRHTYKAGSSTDGAGCASKMMQTEGIPSMPPLRLSGVQKDKRSPPRERGQKTAGPPSKHPDSFTARADIHREPTLPLNGHGQGKTTNTSYK
uniref:G-protein coupled receptors family 1 profile domain-containing protein n=1 Tax=Branchiostoma floridae TaxID=7739 RepID=C3ZCI3_BRAFL|eukprot:XP_002593676.1 hypothetical protein BRAFLDRAFT_108091 [Branchiostoma floridae]